MLALLAAATVAAKLMTRSRFGLVVQAIRNDAERVRFLGYNVAGYETAIYTVAGFFAAVAGCCWVMMTQYVSPAQFDTTFSLSMVIWAGDRWPAVADRDRSSARFVIQSAQSYLGDTFLNTWLLVLGGLLHPRGALPAEGTDRLARECTGAHFDRVRRRTATVFRPIASFRSPASRGAIMGFLEIKNLCKSFDTVGVINDFSMELVERRCAAWSARTARARPRPWT